MFPSTSPVERLDLRAGCLPQAFVEKNGDIWLCMELCAGGACRHQLSGQDMYLLDDVIIRRDTYTSMAIVSLGI